MRGSRRVAVAFTLALLACSAAAPAAAVPAKASKLRLTSPAFKDGGLIPDGFTCDGANASVPLRWRGVPKGTVELALTMEDPDTPIGTFVHWVVWSLDPKAGGIPEQTVPAGVQEGKNGTGAIGYRGPCPPPGAGQHRYRFTLYALDEELTLAPGATIDELRAAMQGTVVAKTRFVGRYGR